MYTVIKTLEIAGAHQLRLPYPSKCGRLHGHNWEIEVTCKSETLDENGMVVDFSKIKEVVMQLDHSYLNEVLDVNPTAENIAHWICERIPHCTRVAVRESEGNLAIYEK